MATPKHTGKEDKYSKAPNTKAPISKKGDEDADDVDENAEEVLDGTTEGNIAQPNKDDKDSQGYIRENAKGGESVHDPLGSKTMREGTNVELGGEEK